MARRETISAGMRVPLKGQKGASVGGRALGQESPLAAPVLVEPPLGSAFLCPHAPKCS